jgi:hypothetical protein
MLFSLAFGPIFNYRFGKIFARTVERTAKKEKEKFKLLNKKNFSHEHELETKPYRVGLREW